MLLNRFVCPSNTAKSAIAPAVNPLISLDVLSPKLKPVAAFPALPNKLATPSPGINPVTNCDNPEVIAPAVPCGLRLFK
uniref:Uncharacterized protein n=1 Tax=uncultured marine virus TaxID=186617 RepID=A0A0F7L5P9_9VIRU|nr:hypothetical protein [uncultured marine virus]